MITRSKIQDRLTLEHWELFCEKVRPFRLIDTILRSCGQVLFAEHPVTGLCMLLAMALLSSASLLYMLLGACISSLAALVLKENKDYIRKGIFGFNGALLGIFWSWYFLLSPPALFLFSLMATIVAVVQAAMMRFLSYGRYNLPVMSLPAVIMLLGSLLTVYWLVYNAGVFSPAALYLSAAAPPRPLFQLIPPNGSGIWGFVAAHQLPVWALILAGILLNSRISFAAAVIFTSLGLLLVTVLPPSWMRMGTGIFLGFNILPLSIALSGLLLVAGRWMLLYTGLACLACLVLWLVLSPLFLSLNLPLLTLPFNLTVLISLMLAKKMGETRSGLITIPLDLVTTPEKILGLYRPLLRHPRRRGLRQAIRESMFGLSVNRHEVERFRQLIREAKRISILSGAGTSTESGIPDFRSNASSWRAFGAEDFTYLNFVTRPDIRERYWAMDRQFRSITARARPNPIHRAIKQLADQGKLVCVVTQNVDGLFQKAGIDPARVIEVHGTALRVYCLNCGAVYDRAEIDAALTAGVLIPYCRVCYGLLKPATILMGEDLNRTVLEEALTGVCASDLLLVIGTSLQVDPVASIPAIARQQGVKIVIINLEPTPKDDLAEMIIRQAGAGFFKKAFASME